LPILGSRGKLASFRFLGHDYNRSELDEMVIEAKRTSDSELLLYYSAGAVSETPVFVRELAEDLPRVAYVIFGQNGDPGERYAEELFAKTNCTRQLAARPQQSKCFVNDVVGR